LTYPNGRGFDVRLPGKLDVAMSEGDTLGLVSGREASYGKAIHRLFDLNGPIIHENGCGVIPDFKKDEASAIVYGSLDESVRGTVKSLLKNEGVIMVRGAPMYVDAGKQHMISLATKDPSFTTKDLEEHYARILTLFAHIPGLEINHSSTAVDFTPAGIHKGFAIERFCREQGIDMRNMVYIGDSTNDLPGMKAVLDNGGQVGVVSNSERIEQELRRYVNVYYSSAKASSGTIECLDYFR